MLYKVDPQSQQLYPKFSPHYSIRICGFHERDDGDEPSLKATALGRYRNHLPSPMPLIIL